MPQSKEGFNLYIDKIIEEVKKNDTLMKLIYDNEKNVLSPSKPNLTPAQKSSLIYSKIFPFRFIPNISTTVCSYLNIGFSNFRDYSNTFLAGKIGFFFVCHKEAWEINGGLRPIFIMEEVKKVVKNLDSLGMGNLRFKECNEYTINDNFQGYYMLYEIVDFKR